MQSDFLDLIAITMRQSFESNVEKVPEDVEVDEPVALPDAKEEIPLRTKLVAYSMIIFFSTGAFFSESTLGPLKSTLKANLNISSGFASAALIRCPIWCYHLGHKLDQYYPSVSSPATHRGIH
jgi:hypothetical protein